MSAADPRETVRYFLHLHEPAYAPLLHYAALPIILTPELLHYLRHTFAPATPWISEADILLDENLCRQYSTYEQYLMHAPIRAYLLGEARQDPLFRQADASRLLLGYLKDFERTRPYRNPRELQTQAWSAMVYIDDIQRAKVFDEIKDAFRQAGKRQAGGYADLIGEAELERLAQITEKLAPEMAQYTELLDYARQVQALIRDESTADERAFQPILGKDMPTAAELTGRKTQRMPNWSHERFLSDLDALYRLFQNGDLVTAKSMAEQLLKNCYDAGEMAYPEAAYDLAVAYFWLGRISRMVGRIELATEYILKAISLFRKLTLKEDSEVEEMELLAMTEYGECLLAMNLFEKAAQYFLEVIVRYEQRGRRSDAALGGVRLGETYLSMGHYEQALDTFMHAKAIFGKLNDARSEAIVLRHIGEVYLAMENHDQALETFTQALIIFQVLHDVGSEAMVLRQSGMALERMGQLKSALSNYHEAFVKMQKIGDTLGEASTLNQLGELCEKMGELEESAKLFRQSANIYRLLQDTTHEGKTRQNLARLLSKLGRNDEARGEWNRFHDGLEELAMRDGLAQTPVKVFVTYSDKDMEYLRKLRAALSPFIRLDELSLWDYPAIDAGEDWNKVIFQRLAEADLVLCLVSADFIASDFCDTQELAAALAAHHKGEKTVVPILLRQCSWDDSPLAKIQGLPDQWIASAADKDAAWKAVSKSLGPTIQQAKQRNRLELDQTASAPSLDPNQTKQHEQEPSQFGDRVQKVLAQVGLGSRREIEDWIRDGRITVNGNRVQLGDRCLPTDQVDVDGKRIDLTKLTEEPVRVLMYYKPTGEVVSRSDPEGREVVFDKLPKLPWARWIAVGRMDINTQGLLLVTTNGELADRLMQTSRMIEQKYAVRVLGSIDDSMLTRLTNGVMLEDGLAQFETIQPISGKGGKGVNRWYHVTLKEGRNQIIRRLFASQGIAVNRLIRIRFADLELPPDMKPRTCIELPPEQVAALMEGVGLEL